MYFLTYSSITKKAPAVQPDGMAETFDFWYRSKQTEASQEGEIRNPFLNLT